VPPRYFAGASCTGGCHDRRTAARHSSRPVVAPAVDRRCGAPRESRPVATVPCGGFRRIAPAGQRALTTDREIDIVLIDFPMPPRLSGRRRASWRLAAPLLGLLTLNGCVVYFSTSPTPVSGATIVFVATDDHGQFVRSLRVTIVDPGGAWRVDGLTEGDGSFRCGIRAGVTRVRTEVVPPAGYLLTPMDRWPRDLEVSGGGTLRVEIHVTSRRS
jgi:hypothetical protein